MADKATKVTWLGEPGSEEGATTEAYGQTFQMGEAVDVTDERTIEKAKGNKFFKVAGDKSPTVETNPELAPTEPVAAHEHDQVENIAFASEERLRAHREASEERSAMHDEAVAAGEKRRPGRPKKS